MTLSVIQNTYAVCPRIPASFLGIGGSEPYTYGVTPGGAGGTIDASSGVYLSPANAPSDPRLFFDTITVTDYDGEVETAQILVGGPLQVLMEAVKRAMSLPDDHIYLYNQKINQPSDSNLYIAVRIDSVMPFGNTNAPVANGSGLDAVRYVSRQDHISFDLISRSTAAMRRLSEFFRIFAGSYLKNQQALNGFLVARDPTRPVLMIPDVDGAAIPYRFRATYILQYAESETSAAEFYDDFEDPEITVNP